MKAIVFDSFGEPAEVLQVRDVPKPEPGPGQVRVRMLASPLNPSDLMCIRGQYGNLPKLPATPGFEGSGVIDAFGPGTGILKLLRGLKPGRRVAVINTTGGNWQEYVCVSARLAVPVPEGMSDEQAATYFVNPASALAMVRHVLKVPAGAWLLQTAAASALGRMVIRLGKQDGFRTINVVRRREQVQELFDAGASAVICTADEALEDRVREITGGAGVPYAIDAVGGATGSAVVRVLAPEGRLLVYGTLAGEPIAFDPRVLMAGHRHIEGFWLANWSRAQNVVTMLRLFRRINRLVGEGVLTTEVASSFPLDEVRGAAAKAEEPGRRGKALLRIGT